MNPVSIHLRPSVEPPARGEAGAVLVMGNDAQAWLAEAAAWPAAASDGAQFYVLPVSLTDTRPGGVLIVPGGGRKVLPSARAMPCDQVHPNVWVPRGATLLPALAADETKWLFLYHQHLVHPSLGLISWDAQDALEPRQLLALPATQLGSSWEMAVPGPAPRPRLQTVGLNLDGADLSFLEKAGADIGDKSHSDFTKTQSMGEKVRDALGGAAALGLGAVGGIIGAGAAALGGLGNLLGAGGNKSGAGRKAGGRPATSKPGLFDFLKQWAEQQTKALQERRHKELDRLMKLLESNPAEGLRFALPLAGDSDARGYAANAGDRLSLRNPSLGNLGRGGGVVDPWNLDANWRWKLQQRYREVAADELKRGRYERAAYIYGELLGEWRMAADALMQGGKFREAARLHQLKTRNDLVAAECLEKGGLLAEAIAIFAPYGQHERCGDLWTRMGRRSEAFRSYLGAVRVAGDRIATARILEQKMHLHGWAAAVLASGWPHSTEAQRCVKEHFALLGRCRAEDECFVQTERLAQHAETLLRTPEAIRDIAQLGLTLPFPRARERFALLGRLAIASRVRRTPTEKAACKFLECLPLFEPDDALLKTDVRRFMTKKIEPAAMPLRRHVDKPLAPVRVLTVSRSLTWLAITSHEDRWMALGKVPIMHTLTLVSGNAEELFAPQSLGARDVKAAWFVPHPVIDEVGLCVVPKVNWDERVLRCRADLLRVTPLLASTEPLAVAPSGRDRIAAVVRSESEPALLNLETYGFDNHCLGSRPLGWAEVPPEVSALPFACVDDRAFLALGNQVFMLEDKDDTGDPKLSSVNLPDVVTRLVATRPAKKLRVVAAWGGEVVLLSPEERWEPVQIDVFDSESPVLHFMRDGNLVIATRQEARVISVEDRIQTLATLCYSKPSMEPPVGVVSLDVSTCGILLPDGRMEIFRVES